MKYFPRSTQLPNDIIDTHLTNINMASLKVLLVIIRQTVGYLNTKTGERKIIDWISITFFRNKTGLTRKSITQALSWLITQNLVIALDVHKNELTTAKQRQGKKRIYYAYKPYYILHYHKTCVQKVSNMRSNPPITKLISTKNNNAKKSDTERIKEILKR